jgi:hypothetical protein
MLREIPSTLPGMTVAYFLKIIYKYSVFSRHND